MMFSDNLERLESQQMTGLWSGPVMQHPQLHPHQHQSPPGLGPLNMMIGGPGPGQHVSMGPMFPVQSPPASSGQFLQLANTNQQRQENAVTPNSTPGLQTP